MFRPLCHGPSKQVYTDGAIYHNNPIQIADKERKLIWPDLENENPDLVVSVGTTYHSTARLSTEKAALPRLGVFSHGKALYRIAVDHIASALDSEKAWHSYMNVLQPPSEYRTKYVRINPQINEHPPRLDEVERMSYIQDIVREMLGSDEKIPKVALRLIASSFYFEKSQSVEIASNGRVQIKGMSHAHPFESICSRPIAGNIHCRLLEDSQEISELGKLLRNKSERGKELFFVIQEEHRGRHAKKVCITNDVIERMVRKCQFKMSGIIVEHSNQLAITEILLDFGNTDIYPISRFPRSLLQDEVSRTSKSKHFITLSSDLTLISPIIGTRPNAAMSSNRWAGRTLSLQLRRKNWIPPNLPEQPHPIDRISHYSRKDYIIGETSQDVLRSIADRLTNGPNPVGAVPELDSSEIESEMAELSRKKSVTREVWGDECDLGLLELPATPVAQVHPDERTKWPVSELSGSRLSGATPTSYRSGPFSEPDDLQADRDNASHVTTHQSTTTDEGWEQAYSLLTHQSPWSRE